MSMFDLFRYHKPSLLLNRPASCATMSSLFEEDPATEAKMLKRCATTRAAAKSGWGIVPVLNELERRSSANNLLQRRSPSAKQLLCLNCRRLFFCGDRQTTSEPRSPVALSDQFCSLDCKSSFEYNSSMQDLVDLQLHEHSATSSYGSSILDVEQSTDATEPISASGAFRRCKPPTQGDRFPQGLRAEQSICRNCRALFFVELAPIREAFCSLDCHTCFEFAFCVSRLDQTARGSMGVLRPVEADDDRVPENLDVSWDSD